VERFTEKLIKNLECAGFEVRILRARYGGIIIEIKKSEIISQTYLPIKKVYKCMMNENMICVISDEVIESWRKWIWIKK